jgi:CRISPR-associated endonuclease Cas1
MAASKTVPHTRAFRNWKISNYSTPELPITPRHGVITLSGYGIAARVERGHLILQDGVGLDRRAGRFPRVNHGIRRVIVIGNDGSISLSALRWLADQSASFVMLERDGSVLITTGPVAASDARVRRAQARLEDQSETAVSIARELIDLKLAGQEQVVREKLRNPIAADTVAKHRADLPTANSIQSVRLIESQGGSAYWSAWRGLTVEFPARELSKVPDHWRVFGSRNSPVSGAPRNACNPGNAMLNFLYTVLEYETRLTAVALGLDPGFGLIHVDSPIRDSLVYDLMEPIRPKVDALFFDWVARSPLKRDWFFEQRDGTCRLMPELISRLAETARMWEREAAPIAEWYAQAVCSSSGRRLPGPRTRLTRDNWREARSAAAVGIDGARESPPIEAQNVCRKCGAAISKLKQYCKDCAVAVSSQALVEGAHAGRVAARSPEAIARRKESSRRQNEALQAWNPADMPEWLTSEVYTSLIQPRLLAFTRPAIAAATGVSVVYAGEIRNGTCVPHRRHWKALATLVGYWGKNSETVY